MSVPEVAHAGEHHRDAALVGRGDHFVVAHAAAGLDHRASRPPRRRTSRPSRNGKNASEATTEPAQRQPGVLRLDRGDARAVDAAHLSGADAERRAAARRTRSRSTSRTWPRARRRAGRPSAPASGLRFVTTCRSARSTIRASALCTSRPPPTRLKSCACASVRERHLEHAHVLSSRASTVSASGVDARRDDHFDELLRHRLAPPRASSARLKAMMPPNADVGSVAKALRVGVERRRGDRHAAGVGVLDDHARRLVEAASRIPTPRRRRRCCCTRAPCPAAAGSWRALPGDRLRRRDRTPRSGAGFRRSAGPAACRTAGSALAGNSCAPLASSEVR